MTIFMEMAANFIKLSYGIVQAYSRQIFIVIFVTYFRVFRYRV